jgi:hypothetical protein
MSEYESKGKGRSHSYQYSSTRGHDSTPVERTKGRSNQEAKEWRLTLNIGWCSDAVKKMSAWRDAALSREVGWQAALRKWENHFHETRETLDRALIVARSPAYCNLAQAPELVAQIASLTELLTWVPPTTARGWDDQSAAHQNAKRDKAAAAKHGKSVEIAPDAIVATLSAPVVGPAPVVADAIDHALSSNGVQLDPVEGPTQKGPPLTTRPEKAVAEPKKAEPNSSHAAAPDGPSSKQQGGDSWIWCELSPEEELATSENVDEYAQASSLKQHDRRTKAKDGKATNATPVDVDTVMDALDSSAVIAARLEQQFAPWALVARMSNVANFVAGKRAQLATASVIELDQWAPVIVSQRQVLGDVASGVESLVSGLTAMGATPESLPHDYPAYLVLTGYAVSAGISALSKESKANLTQVQTAHQRLPLAILTYNARSAHQDLVRSSDVMRANSGADAITSDQRQAVVEGGYLQERAQGIERMADKGAEPTATEVRDLQLRTSVVTYLAQVNSLQLSLSQLGAALDEASSGILVRIVYRTISPMPLSDKMMQGQLGRAAMSLQIVHSTLLRVMHAAKPLTFAGTPQDALQAQLNANAAAIEVARQQFAAVIADYKLDGALFAEAQDEIHNAQVRALIANVIATIAIAMATGGIGAAAGRLVGSAILTGSTVAGIETAVAVVRTARIASAVTSVMVDAGAFSGVQTLTSGGKYGANFIENLLLNTAVIGALKPFETFAEGLIGADEAAKQLFTAQIGSGRAAVVKGGLMTAEVFTAVAVNYVGRRLLAKAHGQAPPMPTCYHSPSKALRWPWASCSICTLSSKYRDCRPAASALVH